MTDIVTNQGIEFGDKAAGAIYKDRPGVYAVIACEGKIAVVKTKDRVFLPGGGLEGEETHQACLQRECSEELGCHVEVGAYIGKALQYLFSYKDKQPLKIIGHFYSAIIIGENHLKIDEDHDLFWVTPEEAVRSMYVEFQAWAIKEFLKHKK